MSYTRTTIDEFIGFVHSDSGEVTSLDTSPPRTEQLTEEKLKELHGSLMSLGETGIELGISYHPVLQNNHKSATLTQLVLNVLQSVRLQPDDTLRVILVGEFSELGRYHMHGIIKTNGRLINLLKRRLSREIGRTEFKQISYLESYCNYVLKDITRNGNKRIIYNTEVIELNRYK